MVDAQAFDEQRISSGLQSFIDGLPSR